MRTPKTFYHNGIVVKFSVDSTVIRYTTYLWIHEGNNKTKISEGIFNDNLEEIVRSAKEKVMENPKYFGYDHDYWMANKERLESQKYEKEMLN